MIGMKNLGVAALCTLAAATCCAVDVGVDANGVYYVDVPSGATETLIADWADAAIANCGAFAKRGEGTLEAGDPMENFTGEIRVEGGIYKVKTDKGLGTEAGATSVSNNATLWLTCDGFGDTASANATHRNEQFYFSGNGYGNYGALRMTVKDRMPRNFTLLGDTLFTADRTTESRNYGTIDMNHHTLTFRHDNRDDGAMFCISRLNNMGNIVLERGSLQFQSMASISGDATCTMTVKKDGMWFNWNTNVKLPWRLVLEDGARIRVANGELEARTIWSGPIENEGTTTILPKANQYGQYFLGPTFEGVLSGEGLFDVRGGQYLVLKNSANTYTGSVALNGANALTNSTLRLYNNAFASSTGNVTMAYGKIELKGASWGVTTNKFDLPSVSCTSQGAIVAEETAVGSTGHLSRVVSLAKSGAGTLTIAGPVCVTGRTEVTGGTVRFGSRVPDRQPGLKFYYKWGASSYSYLAASPAESTSGHEYMGIDPGGPTFAYHSWPHVFMGVVYTGYIWIDGDEPVTWNFAGNVCRYLRLRIDGQDLIYNTDKYKFNPGMGRFTTSPPVTIQPGHHTFYLYMGNGYNSGTGPWEYTAQTSASDAQKDPAFANCLWKKNFGVAYNPNPAQDGPISSNSNDYVAFDASQFTPSLDEVVTNKTLLSGELYRPSFPGGARFAAGTTLDIADALPYTPFAIDDFGGAPTVTNGTLAIGGSWALEAADVIGGGMILAGDANLVFGAGVTLTVANVDSLPAPVRRPEGMPIVTLAGTGSISGMPALTGLPRKWQVRMADGGRSLNIYDISGLVIVFR